MAKYAAGDLLASLMRSAIEQGQDAEAVRTGFMADNSYEGRFNPNLQIDTGGDVDMAALARAYAGKKTPSQPTPAAGTSVRSSTSASRSSYPAGVIDNVIASSQGYIDRGEELLRAVQGTAADFKKEAAVGKTAAIATGEAKATAARTKGTAEVERTNATQGLLAALGLDATDANSDLRLGYSALVDAEKTLNLTQPALAKLREVQFVDDPLGWVKAQFQIQGLSEKNNAAVTVFNNTAAAIAERQRIATAQLNLQPGVSKETLRAMAEAQATAEQTEAQLKALQVSAQIKSTELATYSTEFQFRGMQTQQALQIASLLRERESMSQTEGASSKEALEIGTVNQWRALQDLPPLTAAQYKTMDAKERTKVLTLASGSGELRIAPTPGQSLAVLFDYGGYAPMKDKLSDQGRVFLDRFINRATEGAKGLRLQNPKLSEDQAFETAANDQYKRWRDELNTRQYDKLSQDNPWRLNVSIAAQSPKLVESEFSKFVLAAPNQGAGLTDKDILGYAVAKVQKGEDPTQVASELRKFFYEGNLHQAVAYRLAPLGFDMRNPKKGNVEYPMDGDVFGFFSRFIDPRKQNTATQDLQMFSEPSITNWLIRNAAAAKAAEQRSPVDFGTTPIGAGRRF